MHVVIPFAAPLSEAGRAALRTLSLPGLSALLAGRHASRDEGDEWSLSTPHERALARSWGWSGDDGRWPFAAQAAAADDITTGEQAWGQLTPAHWQLGTQQVSMSDPAALALDEPASRAFFDAVAPLFTSEGFQIHWAAPIRWYLAHESLAGLPVASLDRVVGRNLDRWLPAGPRSRLLRRLQNEVQMRLYTHPLNAEREARGMPSINSFWLSGCGVAQPASGDVRLDDRLRHHAWAEDWPQWTQAWAQIDDDLRRSPPARLTLCGERSSLTWELTPRGLFQRLSARLSGIDLARALEPL